MRSRPAIRCCAGLPSEDSAHASRYGRLLHEASLNAIAEALPNGAGRVQMASVNINFIKTNSIAAKLACAGNSPARALERDGAKETHWTSRYKRGNIRSLNRNRDCIGNRWSGRSKEPNLKRHGVSSRYIKWNLDVYLIKAWETRRKPCICGADSDAGLRRLTTETNLDGTLGNRIHATGRLAIGRVLTH
jgi:hypothetical protein